ncbi:MAG: DNA-binding protein [Lawsonibacter sp.]|nr:DNA-binding protein [Lawsonibacter sp.]
MKSQAYRMTMLFDFYGDVLTDRQKEFYDLYYNEDLSLGEIAENYGITRQGVRDVIVRAEAVLTELEDKTGLIKRFHTMKAQLDQVFQDAGRMVELAARLDSAELETLALRVRDTADTLLKE